MFNRNFVSMALIGLIAYGLTAASSLAGEVRQGVITAIEGTRIVVTTPTEQMAFGVQASTLVSLNGQTAKVTDLRVGDEAVVMYVVQDDNSPIPQRIDAMRPTAPGVPDPVPQF